jgi:perosamine synthetase
MSGIPVNTPLLNGNEKKYLEECIDTGWISSEGPFVKRFEQEFSSYCDQKHGIAVTNGTVALDIAIKALKIGPGDEVIIPSMTIISCASSIIQAGAIPVVVDCHPEHWNMDVDLLESAITKKTKAIMAVHIYGLTVDMHPLLEIAQKYQLAVIEDSAQAHGQTYRGRKCGSMGLISTFSFYPNKHITTGEGGMVLTSDEQLADRCRSLRNLCFMAAPRFVHHELGTNARMTNMQAALGVAQLEKIEEKLAKKRKMGAYYQERLSSLSSIQLPLKETDYCQNLYWVFAIVLDDDFPLDAMEVMAKLREEKIGSRPFFYPIHQQPVLKKMGLFKDKHCPHAERLYKRGFYIPSGLGLSEENMDRVCDTLNKLLK